jgi:hypothetical protein
MKEKSLQTNNTRDQVKLNKTESKTNTELGQQLK